MMSRSIRKSMDIGKFKLGHALKVTRLNALSSSVGFSATKTFTSSEVTMSTGSNHKSSFKPILVSIEGNIGAGKSTLLQKLRLSHPEWIAIDEPVETWSKIRNEKGESILEVFYKDRRRWSYTFQNCALLTRYQNIENTIEDTRKAAFLFNNKDKLVKAQIFLTERCLDTDYHVFTKMLREEGSIDAIELHLYERLLEQLKSTATPLSAIIHVNTAPKKCSDRIKCRNRSGEDAISLDYLVALDSVQTEWVRSTTVPTISTVAESDSDFLAVESFLSELQESIEKEE